MSGGGSQTDQRIGLAIGDYVVTEMVAAGGMGAVYRATHPPSGLLKIVKFMLAEFAQNPQVRDRFERECKAAVRLKGHTNIVEIDSYGERAGEMYLVMEHLRGETFEEHLRRCGSISKQHAFRIVAQIVNALHALHQAGIVHRDLKPANVFILPTDQEAYRVKLIDFGIVHDRTAVAAGAQMTKVGALIGTPGYMALEQFGNAANVTPAADIFALGAMIWEMFTGRLPWSASNEFALYEAQKSVRPMLPADHRLPSGWEPILRLALSPDPNERPALHTLLYALAREIPPEPPVMSGFEMVMRYAPKVLQNTPVEVDTVNAVDAHRAAGAYWAMQRSTAPGTGPTTPNSAWFSGDNIPLTDPGHARQSATTVTERAVSGTPLGSSTTLSGASGAAVVETPSHNALPRRTRLPIALGVAGVVALLTVAVAFALSGITASGSEASAAKPPEAEAVHDASSVDSPATAAAVVPPDAATSVPDAIVDDASTMLAPDAAPVPASEAPKTSGRTRRKEPAAKPATKTGGSGSSIAPRGSAATIDPDDVAE